MLYDIHYFIYRYALLGAGFINFAMSGSTAFTTNYFGRRPLLLVSTTGVRYIKIVCLL